MTASEFSASFCENKHARFKFHNGTELTGVATTFFSDEPDTYYLVVSNQLREFKKHMDANDYEIMRTMCSKLDLSALKSVELVG